MGFKNYATDCNNIVPTTFNCTHPVARHILFEVLPSNFYMLNSVEKQSLAEYFSGKVILFSTEELDPCVFLAYRKEGSQKAHSKFEI